MFLEKVLIPTNQIFQLKKKKKKESIRPDLSKE